MFRPLRRRPRRHRCVVTAVALVLTLGLSACSDGDDPDDDPTSAAPASSGSDGSSPTTEASSSNPTTDPSTEPTEPTASPSVAPSTGTIGKVTGVTARGPRGWLFRQAISKDVVSWVDADTLDSVSVSSGLNLSKRDLTTDDEARTARKVEPRLRTRLPDLTVLGEPAYRLEGKQEGTNEYITQIGVLFGETAITFRFNFAPNATGEAKREEIIASVVASLKRTSS